MTGSNITTYPHIERTPGVRAGKACIAGTRIAVVDVALAYERGIKPEAMATHFSSRPLAPAEIFAALTYHRDHPEELEKYLQPAERAEEDIEAAKAGYRRRQARR